MQVRAVDDDPGEAGRLTYRVLYTPPKDGDNFKVEQLPNGQGAKLQNKQIFDRENPFYDHVK